MKCINCTQENKETAKTCRKCGRELALPPAWFPTFSWHLKTLGIIYVVLIVLYFGVSYALSKLPKPYNIRHIPIEVTPWLRHGVKHLPEEQLRAPGETGMRAPPPPPPSAPMPAPSPAAMPVQR